MKALGKPYEVASKGGSVLAGKARIIARAVTNAISGSAEAATQGDLVEIFVAALKAVDDAEEETVIFDKRMSADAAESVGILLTFAFVGACWAGELLLAKRNEAEEAVGEVEAEDAERGPKLKSKEPAFIGQVQTSPRTTSATNLASPGVLRAPYLHAIGFAKFLMVWHAVLDNYYTRGDGRQTSSMGLPWVVFARWGVIAAPWFFTASGFVNTYTKLTGPNPRQEEDFFGAMLRRVSTWYPLYAFSLTVCALRLWSESAEDWSHYLANMLLINGVIWDEENFPFLYGGWWLSFLMVYLLTFGMMYQVLTNSANSVLWTIFTLTFMAVVPSAMLEWEALGEFAPFILLQYWPAFIYGQALATWFVDTCLQQKVISPTPQSPATLSVYVRRPVHEIPLIVRFSVSLSYLVLGLGFFSFSPYDSLPLLGRPVTPLLLKGGLAPIQGLMIVGLACEVDPVAKLFTRKPFRWAGRFAFTTFIFQVPLHNLVRDVLGLGGLSRVYCILLFLVSVLGHYALERPWRRFLGVQER